jgi:hypothetical protein
MHSQIEINPNLSIADLQIELVIEKGRSPGRSQLYEWLKASWCIDPQPRGGVKQKAVFTQKHLNRLFKLYDLMQEYRNLAVAQKALFEAMKQAPHHYFDEDAHE